MYSNKIIFKPAEGHCPPRTRHYTIQCSYIFVHNSITTRVLNYHCLLSIGKSTFWCLTYCWSVAPIPVAAESFLPSLFLLECDRGVGVVFV